MSAGKPDFMNQKKDDDQEDKKTGRPDFMKKDKEEGFESMASTTEKIESEAKKKMRPMVLSASDHDADEDKGIVIDVDLGDEKESEDSTEYVVKEGDNLSYISRDHYGSADHWKKIWEANKDVIKDPNVIRAGMILKIPKLDG